MRSTLFIRLSLALLVLLAVGGVQAQSQREAINRANSMMSQGRFDEATEMLTGVSQRASGEELQHALFLLGNLEREAADAERHYRRVIDTDPRGEWAQQAQLEIAKMRYATGRYEETLRILEDSGACDEMDEACLFYGLSALSLGRYEEARRPLERIRRGKLRTWAFLSLAEAEMATGKRELACERYEALAGAMISPTAVYRYAECLEAIGRTEAALSEFGELIENFPDTPEAVLAAEKLQLIQEAPPVDAPDPELSAQPDEPVEVLQRGFTIQFGSFRDRGNAIKLASKVKRVFPGVRIDSELIRYREYHRVRYGYYRTRESAQSKGDEIANELGEDFTVMTLP